jgi:hypothetical protein
MLGFSRSVLASMSEETVVAGTTGAGEGSGSEPGRKARPKLSAEEKRLKAQEEYQRRMALVQKTLPPVESAFSQRQSPLFGNRPVAPAVASASPVLAQEKEAVVKPVAERKEVPLENPVSALSEPESVVSAERPAPVEKPEVAEPVSSKSVFLREGSDPNREAVYENLASQLRESKKRREAMGGVRLHLRVSADVFSAVSELAFAKRLDKVEIVTFLLRQHLPKAPYDVVPKWMLCEGEDTTIKEYALPYLQDADLGEAFRNLQFRFQLYRVDLLEAIVLRYLPRAKALVRPKRKVRARVVSKLGTR